MKKVIVVGGGLAGHAAAYKLIRSGKFDVTMLERESRVGGRVQTAQISNSGDGIPVDMGGFIVYPWYEQFHALIDDLGMREALKPIPRGVMYYQLDPGGEIVPHGDIDIPIKEQATFAAKVGPKYLRGNRSAYKPDLEHFGRKTVEEYLADTLGEGSVIGKLTEVNLQGYTYAPGNQYKMAVLAPVMFHSISKFKKGENDWYFFPCDNHRFVRALAEGIKKRGGVIETEKEVIDIKDRVVYYRDGGRNDVLEMKADYIVCAQNVDNELFSRLLETPVSCGYTRYETALVKMDEPVSYKDDSEWGAVFLAPERGRSWQMLSVVNQGVLHADRSVTAEYVTINSVVHFDDPASRVPFSELAAELESLFGVSCSAKAPVAVETWKAMPIANEYLIKTVRNRQGVGGVYFAGDYLGSPSMETAVATGVEVAEEIINTFSS